MQRFERLSDGSGVTLKRFRESMGILGLEAVSGISDRIFALMDEKRSGLVGLEEYLNYMDVLMRGTQEERLEQMFKSITFNSSEFITYDNFSEYLLSVWKMYNLLTGTRISASEDNIRAYFQALDSNQDGQIDIEEFTSSMTANPSLFEWFDFINKGIAEDYTPPVPEVDLHANLLTLLSTLEDKNRFCVELLEQVELETFRASDVLRHPGDCDEPMTPTDNSEEHFSTDRMHPAEALLRLDSTIRRQLATPEVHSNIKLRAVQATLKKMLKDVKRIQRCVISQKEASEVTRQNIEANVPKSKGLVPKMMKKMSFVHWGDQNWNLVLNMMLGIQKAVRWAAASFDKEQDLVNEDFDEEVKHRLLKGHADATIYKFRDYAPAVFERLRRLYGINAEQYIKSLGVEKVMRSMLVGEFSSLVGLCSAGKSGSFFYYSEDGQFVLKTMTKTEFVFFRQLLKHYYQHLKTHFNSLLPRFLGFHKLLYLRNHRTETLYFVVMANVFRTDLEIHERYDLKGSTYQRTTHSDSDRTVARKDLDFIAKKRRIVLGEERRERLLQVLENDCQFFESHNVIDYSLLVGLHINTDEQINDEEGGILDEHNSTLYFIGIIDVLTQYSGKKKLEHWFKSALHTSAAVSCCPPKQYARRFLDFIGSIVI